jgi:hypothetical protein
MAIEDQIIGVESGGDPNAQNPNSSASGPGQFLSGTWLTMMKKYRPDLTTGRDADQILALRSDPDLSRQMTSAYANENGQILSKNGLPVTAGTTYLAHFAGPQGAVDLLKADPSAPISSVMSPAAIKANPFLAGMTVGDVRNWADRKMGGKSAAVQPSNQSSPSQAPTSSGGPPQSIGMLSGSLPAEGQGQQSDQGAMSALASIPQIIAAQNQAPQPLPLDPIRMALPPGLAKSRLLAAMRLPVSG